MQSSVKPIFMRAAASLAALVYSMPAAAHPAEQALVLLLPTELYTFGGTLAVAVSILLISLLPMRAAHLAFTERALDLTSPAQRLGTVTSLVAALGLFALIYVGQFGPTDPQANLMPLTLWTGMWIGIFVVQGLVFNIWHWVNPWTGLYDLMIGKSAPLINLPDKLRAWPAVCLFLAFQIFMLADIAPNDPRRLATLALGYWVFTFAGMILFGRAAWLERAECFSVLFRLIGSLRPVQWADKLRIGFPGWFSLRRTLDPSLASFCLIILISGSFDGLKDTFWWLGLVGINPLEFPGRSAVAVLSTVGLLAANALVIGGFILSLALGRYLVARKQPRPHISLKALYCRFAISILPIALGYHVAHYLVTFMVQGQYLLATLGDPFARGWNIFGLGDAGVTTGFLNTTGTVRVILLTNVWAVVLSHIISVIMAHRLAGEFASRKRDVIMLQLGLSLFMIAYTLFGLWLLSTPRGA